MSGEAIFVPAESFNVVLASQQPTALASNANRDPVGLVWRSNGLGGVYALLTVATPVDTLALVRTNLTPNASIHVTFSNNADGSNPQVDRTISAWSGPAGLDGAYSVLTLEQPVRASFIRIEITDPTNPAGYVEVQRIVIGKRVQTLGVDYGAEQSFEDDSTVDTTNGITTVDRYRVRPSWKFTVSDADDASFATAWSPFLYQVGKTQSFLFIPDVDSAYLQTQATLARVSSTAKGTSPASNFWKLDLQLLAV